MKQVEGVDSYHKRFNSKYATILCLIVLIILLPVILVNFFYDPGEIYFQRFVKEKKTAEYVQSVMSSKYGVGLMGNHRSFKAALAKKAGDYDVIILGSSHVEELSPLREPNFRLKFPGRILNLWVSGATLEDLLSFVHIIVHNSKMPRVVLIDIDPWSLKWFPLSVNRDYLGVHLDPMLEQLGVMNIERTEPYFLRLLKNLISFEYFMQSLRKMCDSSLAKIPQNGSKIGEIALKFDYDQGYDYPLNLPDGSGVYSKEDVRLNKTTKLYVGDGGYNLQGEHYDSDAIEILVNAVNLMRRKGIEVYFIMTPYHHSVFRYENKINNEYMISVEQVLGEIGAKNKIKIFGSYDPKKYGIQEDEFYGDTHAKPSALDKIDFSH